MRFIKWLNDIAMDDLALVGGKNASLGTMISQLSSKDIPVPNGFAVTAHGYWYFIEENKLKDPLQMLLASLPDVSDAKRLKEVGRKIRALFESAAMPPLLEQEIVQAYKTLCNEYKMEDADVAVRSSATAEDLPTASFAGQQESYLNVRGANALIEQCKKCFASLFTDRAIAYRAEHGFDHLKVALSIGIQKMVRADAAAAGVAFSLDTETGFSSVITINGSYGLGESVVKGMVIPDEFVVHKLTLEKGFAPIIKKQRGEKLQKIVYDAAGLTKMVPVDPQEQQQFCLSDEEILSLARMVLTIENFYSEQKGSWSPMDIEWAKDGSDGKIYIVQARPETVHGAQHHDLLTAYRLTHESEKIRSKQIVLTGRSIGQKITTGTVRLMHSPAELERVHAGDIIVTDMTDPDWVPVMRKAAGIITNRGGRTCHAAIVSREMGLPAIVGAMGATETLRDGQKITIDCSRGEVGFVYDGQLRYEVTEIAVKNIPKLKTAVMVNIADPDRVFALSFLPVAGVGLARVEFIISNSIKIHPMAIVHPERIADKSIRKQVNDIIAGFKDGPTFFIDTLAQGIGMIAAAFYPRPVIVRLSDFKSNEYRNLIGGTYFEPEEENPMLGFRGAYRYYNDLYKDAFVLECAALKKARDEFGLRNIKIMIPFVRTLNEATRVIDELKRNGLKRGANDLELVMMCEVPSNAILIDEFCSLFDGFSIGSNDLTQLTLGVDRDSALMAHAFDERDPAVIAMMKMSIKGAHKHKRYIGICGQAPSDYPDVAHMLIEAKIDSLSLNPDAVVPFLMRYV